MRCPVTLVSGPGAAAYAGPLWWRDLLLAAAEMVPEVAFGAILDCGRAPGPVMTALRLGIGPLLFTGPPATARRLASMAAAAGIELLTKGPRHLDLLDLPDPAGACRAWLDKGSTKGRH